MTQIEGLAQAMVRGNQRPGIFDLLGVVFVTNVRPAIEAKEYGHAFCYAVFVLIMTQIFGGMKHHPDGM